VHPAKPLIFHKGDAGDAGSVIGRIGAIGKAARAIRVFTEGASPASLPGAR